MMGERRKNMWAVAMAAVLLLIACTIQVVLNNMPTDSNISQVFMPNR